MQKTRETSFCKILKISRTDADFRHNHVIIDTADWASLWRISYSLEIKKHKHFKPVCITFRIQDMFDWDSMKGSSWAKGPGLAHLKIQGLQWNDILRIILEVTYKINFVNPITDGHFWSFHHKLYNSIILKCFKLLLGMGCRRFSCDQI